MQVHPLPAETRALTGATHLGVIEYTDLTAAGNTQSFNLAVIAASMGMLVQFVRLAEAFVSSDPTLISTAVVIGDAGSANRFVTSTELNAAAATPVYLKAGALASPSAMQLYTAAGTLIVAFTGTAAKLLNSHTAGKLLVFFKQVDGRAGVSTTLE